MNRSPAARTRKTGRHGSWLDNYLSGARPGIFIDVGANLGWQAQHSSVETVVAFEPDPFNA